MRRALLRSRYYYYLEGGLSPSEKREIDEALMESPAARREVNDVRAVLHAAAVVSGKTPEALPGQFGESVAEAIEGERELSVREGQSLRIARSLLLVLAPAAGLVALFGEFSLSLPTTAGLLQGVLNCLYGLPGSLALLSASVFLVRSIVRDRYGRALLWLSLGVALFLARAA